MQKAITAFLPFILTNNSLQCHNFKWITKTDALLSFKIHLSQEKYFEKIRLVFCLSRQYFNFCEDRLPNVQVSKIFHLEKKP